MKTTRHQKGYVFKKGHWWYVRFYDSVMQQDGSIERVQVGRKVAPVCDDYRTKRSVLPLVEEILRPLNNGHYTPESTMTVERFVETIYLPYVAEQKRPSTAYSYKNSWKVYLKVLCGPIRLREFHTSTGQRLLADIARQHDLSRNTLHRIKSLLGGMFKHARRLGILHTANPMQDVSIPKARGTADTYAYSLEEVMHIIMLLPEPAATIVAVAAFTGLRKGELRGLLWENYNGSEIRVTQSVWNGFTSEPKTPQSKAPVLVIPRLAAMLDGYRLAQGNPERGVMFPTGRGTPLHFSNLVNYVIQPTLKEARVKWRGWHAFRRGLATNLYRLGVSSKVIQRILRHANVWTTMNSYIKSVSEDAAAAMHSLEEVCTSMHPPTGAPVV